MVGTQSGQTDWSSHISDLNARTFGIVGGSKEEVIGDSLEADGRIKHEQISCSEGHISQVDVDFEESGKIDILGDTIGIARTGNCESEISCEGSRSAIRASDGDIVVLRCTGIVIDSKGKVGIPED